ncbi:Hemolysin C [compost metagenome]
MDQSYESGEINKTELMYLNNIFAFDDRVLREIMVLREQVVTVQKGMPLNELIQILEVHEFTRYPVIEKGIPDKYIGYINTKEMLTSIAAGRDSNVQRFIHDMPRFLETALIRDVLINMQQSRVHMAVVIDASDNTIGLVTMEDILEEIVGDIRDETVDLNIVSS